MTSIDFTKNSTYADLYRYWMSEDYTLEAMDEDGNWESIDRDQVVGDEGHACYRVYAFIPAAEPCHDPARTFMAEQVERFARMW